MQGFLLDETETENSVFFECNSDSLRPIKSEQSIIVQSLRNPLYAILCLEVAKIHPHMTLKTRGDAASLCCFPNSLF